MKSCLSCLIYVTDIFLDLNLLHLILALHKDLNLSRLVFALHKDFGLVIAFCDHVTFCYCDFRSEELSGGRELPHIAGF